MAARPRVTIRPYHRGYRRFVEAAMGEEQDYFVALDPLGRARKAPGYATRYTERLLRRCRPPRGLLLVAESGGRPVGIIAAELVAGRARYSLEASGFYDRVPRKQYRTGEIMELYVLKGYRRHGVGRVLMLEAERRLRALGCGWIRLEVFAPNRLAQKFYTDLGYEPRDLRLGKAL